MANERECDGPCGRPFPEDDLSPAPGNPKRRLCDECYDHDPGTLDYHTPERWDWDDDGPTPPFGDPGEAGRSDAA